MSVLPNWQWPDLAAIFPLRRKMRFLPAQGTLCSRPHGIWGVQGSVWQLLSDAGIAEHTLVSGLHCPLYTCPVPQAAGSDSSVTRAGVTGSSRSTAGAGETRAACPKSCHPLAWAVLQLTQLRAKPGLLQLPAPLNTAQTHSNPRGNALMPVGCTQPCSPQRFFPRVPVLVSNSL